jgi:hypothetical protein
LKKGTDNMRRKTAAALSTLRHNRRLLLAGDAAVVAGLTYIAAIL